jgi:hypothetical protein
MWIDPVRSAAGASPAVERGAKGAIDPLVHALAETAVHEGRGRTWHRFGGPAGVRFDSGSIGRRPDGGGTIIYATSPITRGEAGVKGGIHVSTDAGRTWRGSNAALSRLIDSGQLAGETWGPARSSRPRLGPIAASEKHGLTAYVGLRGLRESGAGGKPFNGVARTSDGGRTWTIVHRESDRPAPNFRPSWIETRGVEEGYSVWLDAPYDLAAAPGDPAICYVTDLFRTYRTFDDGRTWAQVNSAPESDGWVSRGLDVTTHYGILWDPFDLRRVFIPSTDIGLFRSVNGRASWIGSSSGVPRSWNTTYWLVDRRWGLVWGGFSGTHDLPRPKMWRRTDPARFRGGVAVSTDGARHWAVSNEGMEESAVTHILLDPKSPKGSRTLYAAAFGRGVTVHRQRAVGRSPGTGGRPSGSLRVAPRRTRRHPTSWWLGERGRIGDADDGAIYRSTDGAEHWAAMPLPKGTNGPNAITIDARDPERLYLSAWAVASPGGDTGGGVFVSTDGGRSWRPVLTEAQHVYDVTIDPRDPDVMYACGFDQGVYRSADRGGSWQRIRGFNFKWGHRVVPDPEDPTGIYVDVRRHLARAGDGRPTSTEDVVTSDSGQCGAGLPGLSEAEGSPARQARPARVQPGSGDRLERLVEANIVGVHAYQVLLARRQNKGDAQCYGAPNLSDSHLEALVAHQAGLLAADTSAVKAWVAGKASAFEPATDLEPLLESGLTLSDSLPVNVFAADLAERGAAPRAAVRAVASLYQTVLEVERDGDLLQDLYRFYIGLGLPVYIGQFGLPGSDDDLLETGRQLEGRACRSPVGLNAADWQIAGRKVWNWGEKNLHIRDERVLAKELLTEPEVARLIPRLKALSPQRIAVIGHSFTMGLHWSSPSAFVPIVAAVFELENPKVTFRLFQAGGLTSSRALKRFYQDALAWKPDQVLLVAMNRTDEDFGALKTMGEGFAAAGAKMCIFDNLLDPEAKDPASLTRQGEVARASGATVISVGPLLEASPDRTRFLCLDGIHMREPYHRLMAKEWLAFLAGARGAALPPAPRK